MSAPGSVVDDKYVIARAIGHGGMGAVHEARHAQSGARVAVKVLDTLLVEPGSARYERFRREARVAGALDSPHVVRVLDAGTDAATGSPYLVMDYLEGEDLQRLLKRLGPLDPGAVLRIAGQALLGLDAAHRAGIVHRDIKPANLFLARSGGGRVTVKILDFGLSKIVEEAGEMSLTGTGDVFGSPLYMSPEQARNSKEVDHRTDLWSLGSALYAALTGRAPHQDAANLRWLILSICGTPARPLRERAPWVPAEVEAFVHRALAIDPGARHPSAAAMLEALVPLVPGGFSLGEEMLAGAGAAPKGQSLADAPTEASVSESWD